MENAKRERERDQNHWFDGRGWDRRADRISGPLRGWIQSQRQSVVRLVAGSEVRGRCVTWTSRALWSWRARSAMGLGGAHEWGHPTTTTAVNFAMIVHWLASTQPIYHRRIPLRFLSFYRQHHNAGEGGGVGWRSISFTSRVIQFGTQMYTSIDSDRNVHICLLQRERDVKSNPEIMLREDRCVYVTIMHSFSSNWLFLWLFDLLLFSIYIYIFIYLNQILRPKYL